MSALRWPYYHCRRSYAWRPNSTAAGVYADRMRVQVRNDERRTTNEPDGRKYAMNDPMNGWISPPLPQQPQQQQPQQPDYSPNTQRILDYFQGDRNKVIAGWREQCRLLELAKTSEQAL